MEKLLTNDALQLFILTVFPGLISMHVYRLLLPAKAIDWKTAILEGMFYSAVNFALCLPLLATFTIYSIPVNHPVCFSVGLLVVLLVGPIMWPVLYVRLLKWPRLMKGLQLPYPTAWDAFFDQRKECFMIIHLKGGGRIGGYYGPTSYASAYPLEGDLYIRAVYSLGEDGKFISPIPDTRGLLIRKDEYSYIELFDVPKQ